MLRHFLPFWVQRMFLVAKRGHFFAKTQPNDFRAPRKGARLPSNPADHARFMPGCGPNCPLNVPFLCVTVNVMVKKTVMRTSSAGRLTRSARLGAVAVALSLLAITLSSASSVAQPAERNDADDYRPAPYELVAPCGYSHGRQECIRHDPSKCKTTS